jgi:hypothetical protein
VRAAVEWDQAPGRHLKDAYVVLRGGPVALQGGQFKPPIAPLERESRWDLPSADRGLLSEVLVGDFGVAGRRPGVALEWNPKGAGLARRTQSTIFGPSLRFLEIGILTFTKHPQVRR